MLDAAQRLFAEHGFDAVTIADVADAADVAVQTVFNHFSGKEELFFAGRTPWVDGPADAVRGRRGTRPAAGRAARLHQRPGAHLSSSRAAPPSGARWSRRWRRPRRCAPRCRRCSTSPSCGWRRRSRRPGGGPARTDDVEAVRETRMAASLTAAMWMAAARTLLAELRGLPDDEHEAAATQATVEELAEAGASTGWRPASRPCWTCRPADRQAGGPAAGQAGTRSPSGCTTGSRTSSRTRETCSVVIAPSPAAV